MSARPENTMRSGGEWHKSRFGGHARPAENKDFAQIDLGQSCPEHYPHLAEPLGEPMDIRQVAQLLGSSTWTVRQRYLPSGLPHFRIGQAGKLTFYRNQVVRWVLETQQRKGGRL